MLYDVQKFSSGYSRPSLGVNSWGTFPEAGTAYVERRQAGQSTPVYDLGCSFGRAFKNTETGDWYLQGGNVYCGDKNFFVPDQLVNAGIDGEFLVYIELDRIEANTDDDEEIILPGIKTCLGTPDWENTPYSEGVSYPANTNFTSPTSKGKIIVPLGLMTIQDGSVSFGTGSCGAISIDQCAGVLSFTR